MKRILCPIGCRSDEGLSAPVIKRLREHFDVQTIKLPPQEFGQAYQHTEFKIACWFPDLILITGDRVEMCAAAAAAFHNKVKIAHFYAGIINDPATTYDDTDRHCITLWSDIQFCESEEAQSVVWELKGAGLMMPQNTAHVVGISHLDDLAVDESKVPTRPYNLFLYSYSPLTTEDELYCAGGQMARVLPEIEKNLEDIIFIGGNPDGKVEFPFIHPTVKYDNLPRPQFLGLLKNCQRFITNSSSAIYEAPHFLKPEQIVMVGDRNRNRPRGPFKTGASDRIVEILKEYLK